MWILQKMAFPSTKKNNTINTVIMYMMVCGIGIMLGILIVQVIGPPATVTESVPFNPTKRMGDRDGTMDFDDYVKPDDNAKFLPR